MYLKHKGHISLYHMPVYIHAVEYVFQIQLYYSWITLNSMHHYQLTEQKRRTLAPGSSLLIFFTHLINPTIFVEWLPLKNKHQLKKMKIMWKNQNSPTPIKYISNYHHFFNWYFEEFHSTKVPGRFLTCTFISPSLSSSVLTVLT